MAGLRRIAAIGAVLALQWNSLHVHGMLHSFDLIPIAPPGTSEGHAHVDEYAMMISIGSSSQVIPVLPALYMNTSRTLNVPTGHGCERVKDDKAAEDECNAKVEKVGRLFSPLKDKNYEHRGDGAVETSTHDFSQDNVEYGETIFSWRDGDSLDVFNRTPVSIALFNESTLGMGVLSLDTFLSGPDKRRMPGQPTVDVISVFTGHDDRTGCVILGGYDDNMIDHDNMGVWDIPADAQGLTMNLQAITIGPKHAVKPDFNQTEIKKAMNGHPPSASMDFDHTTGPVTFPCDNTSLTLAYDAHGMRLPEKALTPILALLGNPAYDAEKKAYKLPTNMSRLHDFALVFHFANDTRPVNVRIPARALVMQDPEKDNPLTPLVESGQSYIALAPLAPGETNAYLGRVFLKYVYITNDRKNNRFHLAAINASAPTNVGRHLKDGSPVIVGGMPEGTFKEADASKNPEHTKKSNTGAIVGGVLAALIIGLLLILAILHIVRKRKKTREGSLRSNLISAPFPMAAVPQRPRTPTDQRSPTSQLATSNYPTRRLSSLWLQRPGFPSEHESKSEMKSVNKYGIGAGESSRQGEMAARNTNGTGFTNASGEPSTHYLDDTTTSESSAGHPLERIPGNATPSPRGKGFRPNPLIVGAAAAAAGGAAVAGGAALASARDNRSKKTYSVSSAESMDMSPQDDRFPPSMLTTPPAHGRKSSLTAGFPFPPIGAGLGTQAGKRISPATGPRDEHVASYLAGDANVSSVVETPRRTPNVIVRERELAAAHSSGLTAMSYGTGDEHHRDDIDEEVARTLYSAPTNNSDEDEEWKGGHPAWLDAERKHTMSPVGKADYANRQVTPGGQGSSRGQPMTPGGLGIIESEASTPGGYYTPDSHRDSRDTMTTPRANSPVQTRRPVRRTSSRYSMDGLYPPPLTAAERDVMNRTSGSSPESLIQDFSAINQLHPNADLDPPRHFSNEASTQRERAYTLSQSSRYLPIFPPPSINYSQERKVPRRSTSMDSNPYDSWIESVQPQAQEAQIAHLPSTRYVPPSSAAHRDRQEARPRVQERPLSDASSLYDFPSDNGNDYRHHQHQNSFPEPTTYSDTYVGAHPLEKAPPLPPRAGRAKGIEESSPGIGSANGDAPPSHTPSPSLGGSSSSAAGAGAGAHGDESRSSSRMSAVRDFQYPGRPIRRFVSINEGQQQ